MCTCIAIHLTTYTKYLYIQACQCNGNYSGYDCSRCKFGHYGPNCGQSQVLPRRPLASYTDEEWRQLIQIIQLSRSHDSGYTVILEESYPSNSSLSMSNITLYKLYVWLHHYASKDTGVTSTKATHVILSIYTVDIRL